MREKMNRILNGDKKMDLGTSSFAQLIRNQRLYVDKTKFIENFLQNGNSVQLIVRQRRLGKSLNLDMLRCFLTDLEDYRELFHGLYIENREIMKLAHSAPVFLFDFKNLNVNSYQWDIVDQIDRKLQEYLPKEGVPQRFRRSYERMLEHPETFTNGFLLLTEIVYHITKKRSYLLIDEYDKLITNQYDKAKYEEIKQYEADLFSAGLKGNIYLEKALITGVMRISRESFLSGLNNIQTYDIFDDAVYTDDFGLCEEEVDALHQYFAFDKPELKKWYNGIRVYNRDIYNIYSVLSYLNYGKYDNYWGRSGTLDVIINLLNDTRREALMKLLNGEMLKTVIDKRMSFRELLSGAGDDQFYSLLVQSGYISLEEDLGNDRWMVKIPGRELMNVWKNFILSIVIREHPNVLTVFDHIEHLPTFDQDMTHFLSDRMSFYDIDLKEQERAYHIFVLGLLSGYEDIRYHKPLSNRESGDGRYDILFERAEYCVIFEFKAVKEKKHMEKAAQDALQQIEEKRYYADVPRGKRVMKSAVVFCGKQCIVRSANCNNAAIDIYYNKT
ncbi:MAG: ATP-binding protein [Clostridium sp.]|jgi:hypothetical protein|nr:ATP-binding protein [Clostridium sp.]